jgi:hypothetical protein
VKPACQIIEKIMKKTPQLGSQFQKKPPQFYFTKNCLHCIKVSVKTLIIHFERAAMIMTDEVHFKADVAGWGGSDQTVVNMGAIWSKTISSISHMSPSCLLSRTFLSSLRSLHHRRPCHSCLYAHLG